jgi:hypothetical protein
MRETEVDLLEAMAMLDDMDEEALGRLVEQGQIRRRLAADGTFYFLRADVEKVIGREIEAARSQAADQ